MLRSLVGSEMCIRDRVTTTAKVAWKQLAGVLLRPASTPTRASRTSSTPSSTSIKLTSHRPLSHRLTKTFVVKSTTLAEVSYVNSTVAVSYTHLTLPTIYSVYISVVAV